MKTNVIDSATLPRRAITSVRKARIGNPGGLSHYLMLECGHEIGVKIGYPIPDKPGCYMCSKPE